jgi:hypothetical protein
MSKCCNSCGHEWRLLAIPVNGNDEVRLRIPGKIAVVGESVQLSIVPIARIALHAGATVRRFRQSASLDEPAEAKMVIDEAPSVPDSFSLMVAAPGVRFDSLESARPIAAVATLRFEGRRSARDKPDKGSLTSR